MAWTDDELRGELRRYEADCEDAALKPISVQSYVHYAQMFLRWRSGDYRPRTAVGPPPRRRFGAENVAELWRDHDAYGAELRGANLQPQAVHTYLIHSAQFIRWLDGTFEPGSRLGAARGTARVTATPSRGKDLAGDLLAAVAQEHARRLDPDAQGTTLARILDALLDADVPIRGEPTVTLASALNGSQHRFSRVGRGLWAWKDTGSTQGLSGAALLEEAYLVAKRLDPERRGVHYEDIKAAIQDDGAAIAGGNAGKTLFSVLNNATKWFESSGDGHFRWR